MIRLWVDADACPVTRLAVSLATEYGIPATLVCDEAHWLEIPGAETLTVAQGSDSADYALVNRLRPGDVVITQDYGLAAMCLAKGAFILNQDGREYTSENIDGLLAMRHIHAKIRRNGGRTKGPAKRVPEQDERFEESLRKLLKSIR